MEGDRFSNFTDNEIYMLHRHAIESNEAIVINHSVSYTKDDQKLHSALAKEIGEVVVSRMRARSIGTSIVRSKKK